MLETESAKIPLDLYIADTFYSVSETANECIKRYFTLCDSACIQLKSCRSVRKMGSVGVIAAYAGYVSISLTATMH